MYEFLLASHSNYALSCIISEIKRDIGEISRFFHIPPAFDAPVREVLVGILS